MATRRADERVGWCSPAKSTNGQTTSYAERVKALGGGSSEEAIRTGRPRSVSGAVPETLTINGTVGSGLIDAVVRPQGSSQVKAQPSKAMPIGPVKAHTSKTIRISPRRKDITAMVSRASETSRKRRRWWSQRDSL